MPFSPTTVSSLDGSAATTSSRRACAVARGEPRLVDGAVGNAECDVAAERVVEKIDVLRHVADLPLPRALAAVERLAVDQHAADRRRQQSKQDVDERALAGAGRPDDANRLPALDA